MSRKGPGPAGTLVERAVLKQLGSAAHDLPTRDKIPVIREMMQATGEGRALDVGVGTGYTTYGVFGNRTTVCVDIDGANLRHYRDRVSSVPGVRQPHCVSAAATALPFKAESFRFVLCSEVLEHIEDDATAAREIARVMIPDARLVVTVPYTGLGFTSFLELLRIKTVHDFPGPECHVRRGYHERSMTRLLTDQGLEVEQFGYYFRFFTRVVTDVVSLAHLFYQRIVHGRRAWTWADVTASEGGLALRLYGRLFPLLWTFSRLDTALSAMRGFGLVVVARRGRQRLSNTAPTRALSSFDRVVRKP